MCMCMAGRVLLVPHTDARVCTWALRASQTPHACERVAQWGACWDLTCVHACARAREGLWESRGWGGQPRGGTGRGWGVPAAPLTLVTQTTSEHFHGMHKQVKNSLIQTQRANRKGPGQSPPLPPSPPAGRASAPPRPPGPPAHGCCCRHGPAGPPGARGAPLDRGPGAGAWSSVGGQVPGSTKCRSTGLRGERESGPRLALERGHRSENLPDRRTDGRQRHRCQGQSPTASPAPFGDSGCSVSLAGHPMTTSAVLHAEHRCLRQHWPCWDWR